MHTTVDLKVLYFGTPVVLISTRNADGTANLAPMSSAWWLGDQCMLGMNTGSRTTVNLLRERECVLNLPSPDLADAVDRLALLTGAPEMTPHKIEKGYRHEPDKFGAAGLTPRPADLVAAPVVALRWDPLIMKFCEFFGGGVQVRPSRLAEAWQIPQRI
jgi:flavin reductase (DIM6/NTAB) family NADH-FMN oxidoreductase RutF